MKTLAYSGINVHAGCPFLSKVSKKIDLAFEYMGQLKCSMARRGNVMPKCAWESNIAGLLTVWPETLNFRCAITGSLVSRHP